MKILAIALASFTITAVAAAAAAVGPIVTVPSLGKLGGVDLASDGHPTLAEFRGIPYARPPMGALRWKPPEAYPGWAGDGTTLKNATAYGFACHQQVDGAVQEEQRVDCLFLNIVTPKAALASPTKLPVMIYIHPGAFFSGSGELGPRGGSLVSTSLDDIVLVSMNYRLGVFGFLASSDLMGHTDGRGAGSFGIQDQQLTMEWVRDNIGAFGGNRERTTIFGQSSGGASVLQHLVRPASVGLFQRGIIQSGAYDLHSMSMAEAEQRFQDILAISGCDGDSDGGLQCLVDRDAEDIMKDVGIWYNQSYVRLTTTWSMLGSTDWMPVVDGVSLTDTPSFLIASGNYNKDVPVIIGSVRDEWAGLDYTLPDSLYMTQEEFDARELYSKMNHSELAELKGMYNSSDVTYPEELGGYSKWAWINVRFMTDNMAAHGACSVRWVARLLAEGGSPTVYSFLFAHPAGYFPKFLMGAIENGVFVPHAIDIMLLFNDLDFIVEAAGGDPSAIPDEDKDLAKTMAAYWLSFATSDDADPNPSGVAVPWPDFTTEGDEVLVLDVESTGGIRVQEGLRKAECDWQTQQSIERGVLVNPGPYANNAPGAGTEMSSADASEDLW